jgi:hypothetical protein
MASVPSVSVPNIAGLEVVSPVGLVAVWVVLIVVAGVLGRATRRGKYWFVKITGSDPFGWHEGDYSDFTSTVGDTYTVTDLKENLEEGRQWSRKRRLWVRNIVMAPVWEELAFRGIPYLLAVALGSFHLPLLVAGSAVWAFMHTRNPPPYRRQALPVFVEGLLALYLWLIGLWWLAILVHAGQNIFVHVVIAGQKWWWRWQHTFSPGEEYIVTVDERMQPDHHGLYRAYTPNDKKLYVADVEPGEQTRARVAMLQGLNGYAFPVSEAADESD